MKHKRRVCECAAKENIDQGLKILSGNSSKRIQNLRNQFIETVFHEGITTEVRDQTCRNCTRSWNDSETDAKGWVVINSCAVAPPVGHACAWGLDRREVESLAKTMEVKFTVSGPPIGGAKSGINFDPNDPRKADVLQRWCAAGHAAVEILLRHRRRLNVDEIHEVIPITEDVGIWHPQEGVFTGHYKTYRGTEGKPHRPVAGGCGKDH